MESRWDFIEWLGPDPSAAVLRLLDDPADLARVSSVSWSWRKFVYIVNRGVPLTRKQLCIGEQNNLRTHLALVSSVNMFAPRVYCNSIFDRIAIIFDRIVVMSGFGKSLCLRLSPYVPTFSCIAEISSSSKATATGSSSSAEWESRVREHRVYLYLSHSLRSPKCERNCIYQAISASSTDNYPDESIENTLESSELVDRRPSYWSSGGQRDPGMPESLTYKLVANLCIVDEIKIKPFKAFFQFGHPIYSAKSVQFRMGYSRSAQERSTCIDNSSLDEKYHWTYTSPEFPMAQENVLQSFKLPKPAICLGGILRIELLGRVQKQAMDDLYYICVCHVQVIGRSLSPVLDFDILETADSLALKYYPDARSCTVSGSAVEGEDTESSSWQSLASRLRHLRAVRWNQVILSTLLGPIPSSDDEGESEGDEDGGCGLEEESAV